jgi:hypothetical protein
MATEKVVVWVPDWKNGGMRMLTLDCTREIIEIRAPFVQGPSTTFPAPRVYATREEKVSDDGEGRE